MIRPIRSGCFSAFHTLWAEIPALAAAGSRLHPSASRTLCAGGVFSSASAIRLAYSKLRALNLRLVAPEGERREGLAMGGRESRSRCSRIKRSKRWRSVSAAILLGDLLERVLRRSLAPSVAIAIAQSLGAPRAPPPTIPPHPLAAAHNLGPPGGVSDPSDPRQGRRRWGRKRKSAGRGREPAAARAPHNPALTPVEPHPLGPA